MNCVEKQSFLQGAFILTVAGLISKALGLVYRFPLARLIGDEGMGLYGMAYPIYTMILALSTAGVPVAISKIISERIVEGRPGDAYRIFRVAFLSFSLIGLFLSAILFVGAEVLVKYGFVRDPRAYWGIVSVSPAIFIVSMMSTFRGFFQGWQVMTPTAVSQVLEQLVRVFTALTLGFILMPKGVEFAAAGAVFGAFTGGVMALLVLLYYYFIRRKKILPDLGSATRRGRLGGSRESGLQILYKIIAISIPISLASLVMPIMQNLDLAIVPARLGAGGYSVTEATALYGQLSQMASTLVNIPTIITLALAASMVPAVSEAYAQKNIPLAQSRITTALRVCIFLMLPAFIGFFILAEPITVMLFANAEAGIALAAISPAVLFLGMHQVTSGILQGLGKPVIPVKNLIIGAFVKVGLTYYLTAIPGIGVRGAAYGTVATFVIASFLNLYHIAKIIGLNIEIMGMIIKPVAAVGVMWIAVRVVFQELITVIHSNTLSTVGAICAGAVVYGIVLLLIGGIKGRDLEMIPKFGKKAARILRKLRIVRD
jgi:stage V sporulation protein B